MTTADPPPRYEPISVGDQSTVVAEFVSDSTRATAYQSEAELEAALIELLQSQAYEYLRIPDDAALVANLRSQLEALNAIEFTDSEWQRFFAEKIAGANEGIAEKTARIQEDHVQVLVREDGATKNVLLVDKRNIHNNRLQVINQYEVGVDAAPRANRYDVTILVNGLPLVHVELKRRGVNIREAFNQINRYQRDSFWSGTGVFEYVQLFVISNGTLTKYYSNTTRDSHIAEQTGGRRRRKTSNTFEFTIWWADAGNRTIGDPTGFTKTFFAKHTLLSILTRYCVFDADRKLLVLRPYQIAAAERILQRIETSTNHRQLGTAAAGGYVWHTTGSGKTLTSFKAAQLASRLPHVDKVVFVVDRKDLDYQTMREYERFEKGAANSNVSTSVLKRQLEDPAARIIITTIQKLARFVDQNKAHEIYRGHVVLIFDECHRSRFGDMHVAITKAFKRYHLFGFTGTPIFAENAGSAGNPRLRTTEQAFGDRLHTYTIVDAITDRNVLPFRLDYVNTIRTSRSPRSTPSARCSRPSGSPRSSATSASTSTRRPSAAPSTAWTVSGSQASTRCSRRRRSTPRSAITRSSHGSRRSCRRRSGSRSGSSTATRRTRTTPTSSPRRSLRPTTSTPARATSSRERSPITTRCSGRASTPRRSGSRTTTRISRCGCAAASSTS